VDESSDTEMAESKNLCHTQSYRESCGAACLLVIAAELGVEKMPAPYDLEYSQCKNSGVTNLQVRACCESDIYAYLTNKNDAYMSTLKDAGTALPSQLVDVARSTGLEVKIYKRSTSIADEVEAQFPGVTKTMGEKGVSVSVEEGWPEIGEDQRAMVLLKCFPNAKKGSDRDSESDSSSEEEATLHWVVSRGDDTFMDPATGENYDGLGEILSQAERHGSEIVDTGIMFIFNRNDMPDHDNESEKSGSEPIKDNLTEFQNFWEKGCCNIL
jgi:hypothetical protein